MSTTPAPPGSERRRQLRQQRRRERLRNLWRFLVLLALAGGLGYGLLRQGWVLSGPDQVEVVGSQQVGADQVVQAVRLTFPQPLLGLHPRGALGQHALKEALRHAAVSLLYASRSVPCTAAAATAAAAAGLMSWRAQAGPRSC